MEYAPQIIHSIITGTPRTVYGNVPNHGLIDNLPADRYVEVPCLVDALGVQPTRIGALPPQLAALNRGYSQHERPRRTGRPARTTRATSGTPR